MPLALAPQSRPLPFRTTYHLQPSKDDDYTHRTYNYYGIYQAAKRSLFNRKQNPLPAERVGCAVALDILSRERDGASWKARAFSLVVVRTHDPFFRFANPILAYPYPGGNGYGSAAFAWSIFWDIENVTIPSGVDGASAVKRLVSSMRTLRSSSAHDSVRRIIAFVNVNKLTVALRNELQTNSVMLYHVETRNRKDAADKALMTELLLQAKELDPRNSGIVLISGDQDFSCPLASLRSYGYPTAVIAPTRTACSPLLMAVPNYVLSWRNDVLREFNCAAATSAERLEARNKQIKRAHDNCPVKIPQRKNAEEVAARNKWNKDIARATRVVAFAAACSFVLASGIFLTYTIVVAAGASRDGTAIISVVAVLILALQCTLTWYFIQRGNTTQGNKNNKKKKGNARQKCEQSAKKKKKKRRIKRIIREAEKTAPEENAEFAPPSSSPPTFNV